MSTMIVKSAETQAANIDALVKELTAPSGAPRKPVVLSDSDLDRGTAAAAASLLINRSVAAEAKSAETGAILATEQEEQRVRRDARIATTNRKRMLFGCLETLYRRGLRLSKLAKEERVY